MKYEGGFVKLSEAEMMLTGNTSSRFAGPRQLARIKRKRPLLLLRAMPSEERQAKGGGIPDTVWGQNPKQGMAPLGVSKSDREAVVPKKAKKKLPLFFPH